MVPRRSGQPCCSGSRRDRYAGAPVSDSSLRNPSRSAIGTTTTGEPDSCAGITSQWSELAVAARTAQPSVSSRACAGVTPSAGTARSAGFGFGRAWTRAETRGSSRPSVVRRERAAAKIPTQRSAMTYASY